MNKFNEFFKDLKLNNKDNYLTLSNFTDEDAFLDGLASSLSNGADFIEFVPTSLPTQTTIETAKKIKLLCEEFNATFVIRERLDIAYLSEADGVTLTLNSFTPKQAKQILGENALIGIICTSEDEYTIAQTTKADFIKTLNFVKNKTKTSKKIF